VNEPNMLDPTPELPDDTPISDVELPLAFIPARDVGAAL
jgi:hypothetical protein